MFFTNTTERTATIRMKSYMGYGPTKDGVPAYALHNGETYDVPQPEADWLIGTDLAERV
ncbi:hypothetical protein [Streptomyces sp. NBC_00096]|uniref:hypothetical protein n=1 Tax=Streptomyces sp. NBC_00096 TaxID=2975650 RepID=UPI0032432563